MSIGYTHYGKPTRKKIFLLRFSCKRSVKCLRGCLKSQPCPHPQPLCLVVFLFWGNPRIKTTLPSLGEGSRNRRFWRGEGNGTLLVQGRLHRVDECHLILFKQPLRDEDLIIYISVGWVEPRNNPTSPECWVISRRKATPTRLNPTYLISGDIA
jgi:hypothetical protein